MTASSATWMVVADGAFARIVSLHGLNKAKLVQELHSDKAKMRSHEIGTDQPGRSQQSANTMRSAMEPSTDMQTVEKHRFIARVAAYLHEHSKAFGKLILAAPPKALGELRSCLHPEIRAKIADELPQDYTHDALENLPQRAQAHSMEPV